MAKSLTSLSVEKAKADEARREIPDGGQRGLYLVVQPSGVKSWAVRYRFAGKSRKMTIGTYPELSLKDAREQAREAIRSVQLGSDPGEAKQQGRGTANRNPYEEIVDRYIQRYAKPKNRRWYETGRVLKGIKEWDGRGLASITKDDVKQVLDEIINRAPVMANRTHSILRKFFNWCIDEEILDKTPMARVKAPAHEVSRDRVLSDAELVRVWRGAEGMGYPYGRIVQLLILTGQRRAEVAKMDWSELDFQSRVWALPRERVKNGHAHIVPISEAMLTLLNQVPRLSNRWVFTLDGSGPCNSFDRNKNRLDKLINPPVTGWTLHDLRRTMATGLAKLGTPLHIIEKILNHQSGTLGGIAGIYNRHSFAEEKREAMEKWAKFVLDLTRARRPGQAQ